MRPGGQLIFLLNSTLMMLAMPEADNVAATDRLVACDDSQACRQPSAIPGSAADHARPYPHGCPVFPQLAK